MASPQYFCGTFLALSLSLITLSACQKEESTVIREAIPPVKIVTVGASENFQRRLPGTLRASQRVELAFQVQGRLIDFPIKAGQKVKKGQLLGRLDARDYQSRVDAARAEAKQNASNFERAKELIKKNFISKVEYDRTQALYSVSTAQLEQAQKALADTKLIAPFDGSIANTLVENHQDVQKKQPVLHLQNNNELEISVAVSETLIARRQEKAELDIWASFAALPEQRFALYIKEYSTEADPKTQAYEYILGFSDPQHSKLLPGMTANVDVTRKAGQSSVAEPILIPLNAVVSNNDRGTSAWVLDKDNRVRQQNISTTQLIGRDQVEVLSGLQAGDRVVVAGLSKLSDGMQVKPIDRVKF